MLSEPLAAFMGPDEAAAAALLRDAFGVDVTRTYQFWEAAVARILAGRLTAHGCPWDVEVDYPSQEFGCAYAEGKRQVFKFAAPRGEGEAKRAEQVHTWAFASSLLEGTPASITLTSPWVRMGQSRSVVDAWRCPPTQLLPEVLRCHLHYDRDHHAATRARTMAAAHATEPLL